MSYDAQDQSVEQGQPYFLYQFARGSNVTYLTSDPEDLIRNSILWTHSAIMHSTLEQSGNIEHQRVTLSFRLSDEFAQTYLISASTGTSLTIFRGHHTDLTNEIRTIWKGRIMGAKSLSSKIEIRAESILTSLKRTGTYARVQRTCRHALYQDGCFVDKSLFAVAATVTAVNGLTLTVPVAASQASGYYKAGMVEFDGGFGFVDSHSGSSLVLVSDIIGLEAEVDLSGSAAVTIYPGCDRSNTMCDDLFDNILNNGGFYSRPPNNPFVVSIA